MTKDPIKNKKSRKYEAAFFICNLAVFVLGWYDSEMEEFIRAMVLNDFAWNIAAIKKFLGYLFYVVCVPSLIFHVASWRQSDLGPALAIPVGLNLLSAVIFSYEYVTQTDPSKAFLLAAHWAMSCVIAILAAIFLPPLIKFLERTGSKGNYYRDYDSE